MIKLSLRKAAALSSAAALSVVLSGCGALSSTSDSTLSTGVGTEVMSGKAMGGLQPISGAQIRLFSMGTSGYGSNGTLYATTTTDATGAWSFTRDTIDAAPNTNHGNSGPVYSCAPGNEQQMFVIATGGNTTGNGSLNTPNNPAATLIAVLGACHDLGAGTRVILNEVVTAGSIIAMQQFFNAGTTPGTERFGRPSSSTPAVEANYVSGLTNAIVMVSELVDIPRGHAIQSILPGSSVPGVTVTGTPEFAKMNTIANILASCVNSSYSTSVTPNDTPSGACTTLFANATPPATFSNTSQTTYTFTGDPKDVAQAVYFMSVNPSGSQTPAKLQALYGLQTSTTPFAGTSTQPLDWTIGIVYLASGNCPATANAVATPFQANPFQMTLDKNGNIWVANSATTTSLSTMVQFGANGSAMTCINNGYKLHRSVTIDTRGNIWYTTSNGVIEYITDPANASVGSVLNWGGSQTSTINGGTNYTEIAAIAADSAGNIFFSPGSLTVTTTPTYIQEFAGAATATVVGTNTPLNSLQLTNAAYRYMTATASGNIFISGATATVPNFYAAKSSTSPPTTTSSYTVVATPPGTSNASTPHGLATDLNGAIIGGNNTASLTGKIYRLNNDGTFSSASGAYPGGANGNRGIAVDGANNIWIGGVIPATTDTTNTTTNLALFETDANFNSMSPQGSTPVTCSGSNCRTGGGFQKSFITTSGVWAPSIDASGNVWGASNSASTGNLFVIVGAAVPRITPLVNDLH